VDDTERAVLQELLGIAERGAIMRDRLAEKMIERADDDKVVTATVDGLGSVVDLRFSESALTYPSRLGAQITSAVAQARRAALAARKKAEQAAIADTAITNATVQESPLQRVERVDFNAIGHGDSWGERDAIAQSMEAVTQVRNIQEGFARQRIRQRIGSGAGHVEINAANTYLKVVISPDAPQHVGLPRLAGQVRAALLEATAAAQRTRMAAFGQVPQGESTLADRIRGFTDAVATETDGDHG
jgi:DNA-binding protein YbaB